MAAVVNSLYLALFSIGLFVLISLGLAIIFGLMRVINLAHGELLMLGAYTVLAVSQLGGGYWLGLLLAPLVVGLVGLAVEELLIRRIYHRMLDTILATWGLSLFLRQFAIIAYGPGAHSVPTPTTSTVILFGAEYPLFRLIVMAIALAAITATFWLFFRTRTGLAARAVIANRGMASCLGVDTRALDRLTFGLGAALAGLAGAALAPLIAVDPKAGLGYLVPAFLSILVGGLGSIGGPVAGAATVGVVDNVTSVAYSQVWAQVVVFVTAIVVIRLFPSGLIARRGREA
jgi:branched-chain amino acid transport system permease protein/urea transport system permease protein